MAYLYSIDKDYFKQIDSHEKAQILGFIAADGCIIRNKKNNEIRGFCVIISQKDIDYLEWIKRALQYQGPIRFREKGELSILAIYRSEMANDLIKLGITPAKSQGLLFPTESQVPPEFLNSYIRGYFEGDGCISATERNCAMDCVYKICSSKSFILSLQHFLKNKLDVNSCIDGDPSEVWSVLSIGGNKKILKIADWMYNTTSFVMKRKFDIFEKLRNQYDSNGYLRRSNEKPGFRGRYKESYVKDPDNKVYHVINVRGLCREYGLHKAHFYQMLNGSSQYNHHKGWKRPTAEEIAAARESGTLIEKHY